MWDDERIALLTRLWQDGRTATQIAKRLGNCSRSAVIGKVHRLGLAPRAVEHRKLTRSHPRKRPRTDRPPPRPSMIPMTPPPREDTYVVPMAKRVGVLEVEADQCRWIYGDPRAIDMHFCDQKKVIGLSFCPHHAQRVFQPARTEPARVQPVKQEELV